MHGDSLKQVAKCSEQKFNSSLAQTQDNTNITVPNTRIRASRSLSNISWLENGIPYLQTSAKENTNVDLGFTRAVHIWEQIHGYSDMIDITSN